ncbi:hypothetical protein TNCV_656701 [Trichonephila clavipes]|nr:hypothetical protein TNCV_656701 [Trichonephila clavipes]
MYGKQYLQFHDLDEQRRRHFYLVGQSKHKVGACGVNNQASAVLAGNELPVVAFTGHPVRGLIEHIFNRLEPHALDYVEVRNRTTRSCQVISKFEERYLARETQSPSSNSKRRDWDAHRRLHNDRVNGNWSDAEVIERQNDRRDTKRNAYRNKPQGNNANQKFEKKNRNNKNDHGFENRGGRTQFENRGPSDIFNRGDRRHSGRSNCLKIRFDQDDQ